MSLVVVVVAVVVVVVFVVVVVVVERELSVVAVHPLTGRHLPVFVVSSRHYGEFSDSHLGNSLSNIGVNPGSINAMSSIHLIARSINVMSSIRLIARSINDTSVTH